MGLDRPSAGAAPARSATDGNAAVLPRPDGRGEQLGAQPPMPASAEAKPGGVASEESVRERSTPRRGRLAYAWERWLRYFWLPLVICGAFVAVLVIALTQSNVKDRAKLADEFSLRTAVSGRLVESYLSGQQALMVARAEGLLSGPTITPENLKLALVGARLSGWWSAGWPGPSADHPAVRPCGDRTGLQHAPGEHAHRRPAGSPGRLAGVDCGGAEGSGCRDVGSLPHRAWPAHLQRRVCFAGTDAE